MSIVFVGSDERKLFIYSKNDNKSSALSEDVHFLGFVSGDDLVSLYRNAFALLYLTFFGSRKSTPS